MDPKSFQVYNMIIMCVILRITPCCVFSRWEDEYTARIELQEKVAELEEVKKCYYYINTLCTSPAQ